MENKVITQLTKTLSHLKRKRQYGHPPIYVLTIPEAEHRRLKTKRKLEAMGIKSTALFGVSKYQEDFQDCCLADMSAPIGLSKGAMAVAMTHIQAWAKVIRENLGPVIILEDDAIPQIDDINQIGETMSNIPPDWEFAVLHSWGADPKHGTDLQEFGNRYWWRTSYPSNTLAAYALTEAGARQLIRHCVPYFRPIDEMVQKACGSLRAYQVKVPLFNADYSMGSILNDEN